MAGETLTETNAPSSAESDADQVRKRPEGASNEVGGQTASETFIATLVEVGVACVFVNLGSDHPGLIEAIAERRAKGDPCPRIITCPNEMVALSAAHGHARVSGRPQCVVVHVECGTQALGGAVHNAARGRVPVLIFAGASPATQEGEALGTRNEFIQWIQDVHDQRGLVRGYMKYDAELRSPHNVRQMTRRALQFACSEPAGPVYLMGAREVMEAPAEPAPLAGRTWPSIAPVALSSEAVDDICDALAKAERPLLVTSYLGRDPEAVPALAAFAERHGVGVLESVPWAVNMPADHPMYLGSQWNDPDQNEALAASDLVLVVDSDVPWIAASSRPRADARILHIDVDPLKDAMPLWDIGAHAEYRAASRLALAQLSRASTASSLVAERTSFWRSMSDAYRSALRSAEEPASDGSISARHFTAAIRAQVDDKTLVLNEGITNYGIIHNHMAMTRPGSLFASGGGSLGWNGGAAVGAKLAAADHTVVALGGDGCFMFSVPSSVHWMARRYEAPILQVVYCNGGWNAPRHSTRSVHPHGRAAAGEDIDISFEPTPDYAAIAAASGDTEAITISRAAEVDDAVAHAFRTVRGGRSVVLAVHLDRPPEGEASEAA